LLVPRATSTIEVLQRPLESALRAAIAVVDQLGLEAVDERLGEGVVVGVADRADRGEHAVVGQRLGVVDARVLRAANAVVDKLDDGARLAAMERQPQCV
jgi:hypothetical protein